MKAALACVVILCASGVARADALDDARRHYRALEYDQAVVSLEAARRAAADRPTQLAETWLLEGQIEVALGREPRAIAAFQRALRIAAAVRLPADSSPKLRGVFEQAEARERERARHRAGARARLLPIAPPPVAARTLEAIAEVDNAYEGLTARLEVSDDGALQATLSMVGRGSRFVAPLPAELVRPRATLSLRVALVDDGEVFARSEPIALTLPARSAALQVTSPQSGGELSLDGKHVGRLPLPELLAVEPGLRRLSLSASGGAVHQSVDVRAGEVLTVTLSVAPVSPTKVARYTLLALGGALLVSSGALFASAASEARDLERAATVEPGSGLPAAEFSTVRGFESNGRAFDVAAITSCVVGAVAVTTGALLFLARERPPVRRGAR